MRRPQPDGKPLIALALRVRFGEASLCEIDGATPAVDCEVIHSAVSAREEHLSGNPSRAAVAPWRT
jgi:hypothetical protein